MAKIKPVKKAKSDRPEILPVVCVDHGKERYHIEIELPGVKKEDIDLEMGDELFCLKAPKEDLVYSSCYALAHSIDAENVDAKFDNGLLTIKAPFKSPIQVGIKIPIK